MTVPPDTVPRLEAIEDALARGLPVHDVLDLVDDAIEQAGSAGDATTLERLAALLEGAAPTLGDGRGLSVAAHRARGLAAAVSPAPAAPPEAAVPGPDAAPPEVVVPGPVAAPPEVVVPVAVAAPPEPAAAVAYAGWWRRVCAHVVDWVAILVVLPFVPAESDAAVLAVLVLPVAYFAGMHAFVRGQTIGKALFGIAVRMDDGLVDLPRAIGRALVQGMLWVTVIGGIVDSLAPIGDARNRALHDRAVGTVVVRVR